MVQKLSSTVLKGGTGSLVKVLGGIDVAKRGTVTHAELMDGLTAVGADLSGHEMHSLLQVHYTL